MWSEHVHLCVRGLFLRISYWTLELFRQCGIFLYFFFLEDIISNIIISIIIITVCFELLSPIVILCRSSYEFNSVQ